MFDAVMNLKKDLTAKLLEKLNIKLSADDRVRNEYLLPPPQDMIEFF